MRGTRQADRRAWLAVLVTVSVTTVAACSSAAAPGSPSQVASLVAGSPSATASSSAGSQTTAASPAVAVVRATTLATRLPTGLSREVAIVVGTRIFVVGGFAANGSTTAAILGFDPATGRVESVGALAVPVHDAGGVAVGSAMLIFGGGNAAPVSVVQRIDSSGVARVVGHLPSARADLAAVSLGSSAIVIGGGAFGVLDRPILLTEDGAHFRVLATLLVGVRYAAVAEAGGLIYVIGGVGAAGDRTEIQRIDPATGRVDLMGRMPEPISHASAMVIGGRLLVVGGRSAGKAQDAIWQVDLGTGTSHLVARLPQPVSDVATAVIDGTGYVIGGETDTQVASIVSIVVQ